VNPDQLLAHFKRLTSTLSASQLATLAGVFLAVVGVLVGTTYWISAPTYTVLFSDLDAESAQSVVSRLKTEKVQYQLDDGGRTVRVPSQRLDELRLEFSSQGMPASGRIGFEIFDRTAFGTTEFLEHVNYRRALEGELARTIGTIGEVASARVHIAMAKESLFASQTAPAKASVVLKLKGRKPLAPQTINAITGLVASSVEDLRPESVVVLDTFGRSLTAKAETEDETTGLHLDQQHRLERELTTKVVALLEPIVGEGRVRVNVAARLDADSAEETEERWDPTTVLRSKQTSSDVGPTPAGYATAASVAAVPGVAGARANTPPPVPANAAAGAATTLTPIAAGGPPTRTTESSNYEVSKLTRHTITPSGQIARLSVAVVVDDDRSGAPAASGEPAASKPRSAEEIERIHKLVAAAVGFEEDRGDQLTVENISFEEPSTATAVEPPQTALQKVTTIVQSNQVQELGRTLAVIALALLAFFLFLKPLMNKALTAETRVSLPAVPGAAGLSGLPTVGALEQQVDGARQLRKLPALTQSASKLAEDEPESVARLVRSWIADND
jgi:flagellar M-ring protein FliF